MRWAYRPPPAWMLVTVLHPPYESAVRSRMPWNSLVRYSPSTPFIVDMYLRARWPTSGFSRSDIDGAVTMAPPAMSSRWRTIRLYAAAPVYLPALVYSSLGKAAPNTPVDEWAIAAS